MPKKAADNWSRRSVSFTTMRGGETLMIRANRVAGDRAAPDRGNDGDMGTVIDLAQALQLELACQVTPDGKANVRVRGELDIATADQAYNFLRDVVDNQDGPVLMNLSELAFRDAAAPGTRGVTGVSSSCPQPGPRYCGSCTSPGWTRRFPRFTTPRCPSSH